jgi:hypothetical protein
MNKFITFDKSHYHKLFYDSAVLLKIKIILDNKAVKFFLLSYLQVKR